MQDQQIHYWAHMLDESSHASYYDIYMLEHPEDKQPAIVDSLLQQFAADLQKDKIDVKDAIGTDGYIDQDALEHLADQIKTKYYWRRIRASTYAAIVSRMTALLSRAKGQRLSEQDIEFDDVAHTVSRKTIEDCLDIVCHNTNVIEANNALLVDAYEKSQRFGKLFQKHGLPKTWRYDKWHGKDVEDYLAVTTLYRSWGAYAKGNAGEKWVCDSDNGPAQLKKVLDSVEYSADDIDLAVTLNKSLDIVHFRSDLAAAFIEGGQQTCALVSNLPDKFVI